MFPWGDNRRFNSYSSYFTREFGSRVQKISIDAGFSCPNRDGSKGIGGCILECLLEIVQFNIEKKIPFKD